MCDDVRLDMDFTASVYLLSLGTVYPAHNAMSFLTTHNTGLLKDSASAPCGSVIQMCVCAVEVRNPDGGYERHMLIRVELCEECWHDRECDECLLLPPDSPRSQTQGMSVGEDWDSRQDMQSLMRNNTKRKLDRAIEPSDGTYVPDDADESGHTDKSDQD